VHEMGYWVCVLVTTMPEETAFVWMAVVAYAVFVVVATGFTGAVEVWVTVSVIVTTVEV
jgi:hypothetical protein